MPHHQHRRDFIRSLVVLGASLYLPSCKKKENPPVPIITKDPKPIEIEKIVQQISEQFESENLVLLRQTDTAFAKLNVGFNTRVLKTPKIIALCKNATGVSEAMKYAKQFNLQVSVKSGGHSFEAFSSNDDGMVVNLSLFDKIEWLDDETVKMGAGVKLFQIYDELLPKGKIIPAGSCATVGIGGLTLGGGYGLFSRKYGLTCDALTSLTMIDGHGNIHKAKDDDEILWACRGGNNGNFGIVTDFTFKVYEKPKAFTRHLFKAYKLDVPRAKSILEKWFDLTAKLPDSCFGAFVLNGKTLTILITDADNRRSEIQPVLASLKAVMDKTTLGKPTRNLQKSLRSYYGIQTPIFFKNASAGLYENFKDIENCIEAVIEKVHENRGIIFQVNTLGGQINNPTFEANSCYPHRAYPFLAELQAYPTRKSQEDKLVTAFEAIQNIFKENGIDRHYRNYPDINFENWAQNYYRENYARLQKIKEKYDPDNVIWHEQSVKT